MNQGQGSSVNFAGASIHCGTRVRVVIGGGKDDQPRPSCVNGSRAIAFTAKYVLYKNPKYTRALQCS